MDISCKGTTLFYKEHLPHSEEYTFPQLAELAKDVFVIWNREGVQLTYIGGHYFIRTVCSTFYFYLNHGVARLRKYLFKLFNANSIQRV